MKAIDIAIGMLDSLDPILGYDLEFIKTLDIDEAERNIKYLRVVSRCRGIIHTGALLDAWDVVFDSLGMALEELKHELC